MDDDREAERENGQAQSRADRENVRIAAYLGLGSGFLFILVSAIVVLTQTFAPLAGLQAGSPDPIVLGSMLIWAGIALGILPATLLAVIWRKK